MENEESSKEETTTRFKEKHSLDSDEEDDGKKYDVLAEDDIEGQEEATIDFDEDIQITPFNMREEMEEGHFDSDGTYIFDKSKEIKDSWMDNIDWVKVKHLNTEETSKKRPFQYSDSSDDDSDEEQKKETTQKTYEDILKILQEGETVAKAMRRLAKNKAMIPTASQRWKNKKLKASGKISEQDQEAIDQAVSEQKEMLRLTELCDLLVHQGIMDIYDTSYERIAFTLKQMKEKEKASRLTIAEGMKDDDALDMFADDFDAKQAEKSKGANGDIATSRTSSEEEFKKPKDPGDPSASNTTSSPSSSSTTLNDSSSKEVMWEYKESQEEGAEIKGPFPTSQMLKWADSGKFGKGVFCRKYQSEGQFYNSSRLDFELYE